MTQNRSPLFAAMSAATMLTFLSGAAVAQQVPVGQLSPLDFPRAPTPLAQQKVPNPAGAPAAAEAPAPSPLLGQKPPLHLSFPMHQRVSVNPALLQELQSQLQPVTSTPAPQTPQMPTLAPPPALGSPLLPPDSGPASGSWFTGSMPSGTPVLSNPLLLGDGTVIAHQSCTGSWWKLTPDIYYNYAGGTWAQIASMPAGHTPRFFSSAVLSDGRVIVEGGEYNTGCAAQWTNKGSIYNPWTDSWDVVPPPAGWANIGYQSIVLADGIYMQADVIQKQAALFDPGSYAWTPTGGGKFDSYDEESLSLLQNNKVLTVDAYVGTGTCGSNTELYDPAAGTWSSAGNTLAQLADCQSNGGRTFEIGPAPLRRDGSVVAFAGTTGLAATPAPIGIYSGGWSAGPNVPAVGGVNYTLADAPAVVLPNNNILFAASPKATAFSTPTHFFEMTPGNVITQVADNSDSAGKTSFQWNFLVLPNGNIMALTTDGPNVWYYSSSWQFFNADAPVVTSAPVTVVPGETYFLNGTQLAGKTQGAYYGDDQMSATNYPIIFLYDRANNRYYRPTVFGMSSMSVKPGESQSASFTVPFGAPQGPLEMYVCASGVCGGDVFVNVVRMSKSKKIDFNSDGKGDFTWQNLDSGTVVTWEMNGTSVIGSAAWYSSRDWAVIGSGDFNGDGYTDILWRNADGNVAIWLMSGTNVLSGFGLGQIYNGWSIVGVGDFDGDGKADILWRYTDGSLVLWRMNGYHVLQSVSLGAVDPNWKIIGLADFNGDGKADILWRYADGSVAMWLMSGANILGSFSLGQVDNAWTVTGTGNFYGNGDADILWRYSDGTLYMWEMNGPNVIGGGGMGTVGTGWNIVNTGDFNGDGKDDILWRYIDGSLSLWELNGTSVIGGGSVANVSNDWTIAQ